MLVQTSYCEATLSNACAHPPACKCKLHSIPCHCCAAASKGSSAPAERMPEPVLEPCPLQRNYKSQKEQEDLALAPLASDMLLLRRQEFWVEVIADAHVLELVARQARLGVDSARSLVSRGSTLPGMCSTPAKQWCQPRSIPARTAASFGS